jgi:hypothetical protein
MARKKHDDKTFQPAETHEFSSEQLVQLRINGKIFLVPVPFSEGHILSSAEADVLNQTYRENLRNNFAAAMRRAAEKEQKELMQSDFDAYVETYSFEARTAGSRSSIVDPVDVEEHSLAMAAIKQAIKAKGVKFSAVAKEKIEELVNGLVLKGSFRHQAEQIVAERKSMLGNDLLGDMDLTSPEKEELAEAAE